MAWFDTGAMADEGYSEPTPQLRLCDGCTRRDCPGACPCMPDRQERTT